MKKIVIMGASSGIGLAVAEAFASRGIKVGLGARRTEALKALKEKYPEMVEYSKIDITHEKAAEMLVKLADKLGGMDIYFHVAGIGYENPTLDPQREVQIVETNAAGFARMISAAYDYFRDNKIKGRIAAVTSVAGTNGIGSLSAYSASKKFAQTYLVALEQRAHTEGVDIRFTDIRPGWIRTPLLYDDVKYPMEMSLDYATIKIIKAIVRAPRVAVVDWRWDILVGLWRMVPNALWVRMDYTVGSPDKNKTKTESDTGSEMNTDSESAKGESEKEE